MKEEAESKLLQWYIEQRAGGKEIYLDWQKVKDLLDEMEFSQNFTYYEEVLRLGQKLYPDSKTLRMKEVHLYIIQEDYQRAYNYLESLDTEKDLYYYMLLIEIFCGMDRYDRIKELFDMFDKTFHEDMLEEIYEHAVMTLNDYDMQKESYDLTQRGLKLYPDNITLKEELCFSLEDGGNLPEAIKLCNELIDYDPYSADYWSMMGRLYTLQGNFDKALEAFEFVHTCGDMEKEMQVLEAYSLYMNENYDKAIEAYTELLDDKTIGERIKPFLAECYIKIFDYEKAYQCLRDAYNNKRITLESFDYSNLIHCCFETERSDEAVDVLKKAIQEFPDNPMFQSLLIQNYMVDRAYDEAQELTKRFLNNPKVTEDEKITLSFSLISIAKMLESEGDTLHAAILDQMANLINPDVTDRYDLIEGILGQRKEHEFDDDDSRNATDKINEILRTYQQKNYQDNWQKSHTGHLRLLDTKKLSDDFLKNKNNRN